MPEYTVKEMIAGANSILQPRLTDNRLNGIEQDSIASVLNNNTRVLLSVPASNSFDTSDRTTYAGLLRASLSVLTGIDGHHSNDFTPWEFYNSTDFVETAASAIEDGDATRTFSQ